MDTSAPRKNPLVVEAPKKDPNYIPGLAPEKPKKKKVKKKGKGKGEEDKENA